MQRHTQIKGHKATCQVARSEIGLPKASKMKNTAAMVDLRAAGGS